MEETFAEAPPAAPPPPPPPPPMTLYQNRLQPAGTVVDPVLVATSGDVLLREGGIEAYREALAAPRP